MPGFSVLRSPDFPLPGFIMLGLPASCAAASILNTPLTAISSPSLDLYASHGVGYHLAVHAGHVALERGDVLAAALPQDDQLGMGEADPQPRPTVGRP